MGERERGASAVEYAILVAATAALLVGLATATKKAVHDGPYTQFCNSGTVIRVAPAPTGTATPAVTRDVECHDD